MESEVSKVGEESTVRAQMEDLKGVASGLPPSAIRDGSWFVSFLAYILGTYAETVDAAYFKRKYPNIPADAVVARRIELAQRYSAIEGGLSAGAYSTAVAATIGTGGGASPLTLPAAVTSFVVDLLYTTKLQLELAYDLSVLYGHPIDLKDPEDLYDLFRVAFGVKAGEAFRGAAGRLAPEAARVAVKQVVKGANLAALKALPVIGKYMLQRNIIKFAIPVVAVPLSAFMNHYSTGAIGRMARQVYRDKASIREAARDLVTGAKDEPLLFLQVVYATLIVNGEPSAEGSWLMNALTLDLGGTPEGTAAVNSFRGLINIDVDKVLSDAAECEPRMRTVLLEAAMRAAAVDHNVTKADRSFLRRVAERCGLTLDEAKLDRLAKL